MAEPAIEIRGLKKSFGEVTAVRDVELSVTRGQMFGLVGPDGAGKTTLIRMLCGIVKPDAGTATVLGLDLATELDAIKKRIGYLSQRFSLYPDLSIDENIEFFAEIHEVKGYQKRRDELLEFTRLTPFRNRLADRLSGGMKQKLALACTLIHTPDLIFLDEPTTGVDPVSRRDFWKILSTLLKDGITIFMTTPYLDEAERCTRVGLMGEGKILVTGTPKEVKQHMQGQIVEIVVPNVREAYRLLRDTGNFPEVQAFGDRLHVILPENENDEKLRALLESHSIPILQMRRLEPSLENVFISLVQRQPEPADA